MTGFYPSIRLYTDQPLAVGQQVSVTDDQAHYLGVVMRRRVGDKIELFNGTQDSLVARIAEIGKKAARLETEAVCRTFAKSPDIWLVFAPVKRTRLDFMAQKATELGVCKIQPVNTQFCQVDRVRTDRLRANAIEAAEQTGRLDIPDVGDFVPLEQLLDEWPRERAVLFCDEMLADSLPQPDMLACLAGLSGRAAGLFIGPEGGFSPTERTMLNEMQDVIPLRLGPRILRSDTAALAALSLYQAVCGDWQPGPQH